MISGRLCLDFALKTPVHSDAAAPTNSAAVAVAAPPAAPIAAVAAVAANASSKPAVGAVAAVAAHASSKPTWRLCSDAEWDMHCCGKWPGWSSANLLCRCNLLRRAISRYFVHTNRNWTRLFLLPFVDISVLKKCLFGELNSTVVRHLR